MSTAAPCQNELCIQGKIPRRALFTAPNGLYGIYHLQTSSGIVTITGNFFGVDKGDNLVVWGNWENHPTHGRQFKVCRWEKPIPSTVEQVEAYLTSPFIKGVGRVTAKRITDKLGSNALTVILDEGPEILYGIKGVTKPNAAKIYNSLHETYEIQRIVMQLSDFGISPKIAIRAYQRYGSSVVELVKYNPYCLTYVSLVGFDTADEIASNMGIAKDSPYRIKAALKHTMEQKAKIGGHCYVDVNTLTDATSLLLNKTGVHVKSINIEQFISPDDDIMLVERDVYLKKLFKAEMKVAEKINFLCSQKGTRIPRQKIEITIKKYELANRIRLETEQREAV